MRKLSCCVNFTPDQRTCYSAQFCLPTLLSLWATQRGRLCPLPFQASLPKPFNSSAASPATTIATGFCPASSSSNKKSKSPCASWSRQSTTPCRILPPNTSPILTKPFSASIAMSASVRTRSPTRSTSPPPFTSAAPRPTARPATISQFPTSKSPSEEVSTIPSQLNCSPSVSALPS